MCPDSVVAYHESLSSFRPGSESQSGRLNSRKLGSLVEPLGSIDFSAITKFPVLLIYLISESVYLNWAQMLILHLLSYKSSSPEPRLTLASSLFSFPPRSSLLSAFLKKEVIDYGAFNNYPTLL